MRNVFEELTDGTWLHPAGFEPGGEPEAEPRA